jgi:formate/nitrite transporter FocA (FNT family)
VLVIIAGAELFTGNALIAIAWASQTVSTVPTSSEESSVPQEGKS